MVEDSCETDFEGGELGLGVMFANAEALSGMRVIPIPLKVSYLLYEEERTELEPVVRWKEKYAIPIAPNRIVCSV